jgi:hypothetical protein
MLVPEVNVANRPGDGLAMLVKDWFNANTPLGEEVSKADIWLGNVIPDAKAFTRIGTVEAIPETFPICMDVSVAPTGVGGITKLAEFPVTVAVTTTGVVTPATVVETTAVGINPGEVVLVIRAGAGCMITVRLAPPAGIDPVHELRTIVPTGSARP